MSVFVTVGTTSFDPLVEAVDQGSHADSALIQIADGSYEPVHARWFRYEPSIREYIDEADVVVCHAGAGSIFRLLEAGIVPLVVPNTVRRDKHQVEIARWLERKRYAVVAMQPEMINSVLDNYAEARLNCVPFAERRFFYQKSLNQVVRTQLAIGEPSDESRKNSAGKFKDD